MIEKITFNDKLIAIILSHKFNSSGIHFFTTDDLSQQLAYMRHPVGKSIEPHVHNPVRREVHYTQEVLFIKKGKLRADFYDEQQNYLSSRILEAGDVLFLATGGHGFEVIEEIEMIEVKQGPYAGDSDKTRFKSVESSRIVIEGNND
jgi:mannose-6-phosphate isomerase-like protein (cupin superfamily)